MFLCFRHLSCSLGMLDIMFMSDRQQDATEFLVRLLDLFREHCSSSKLHLGLEGLYFLTLDPSKCQIVFTEFNHYASYTLFFRSVSDDTFVGYVVIKGRMIVNGEF